MNVERELEWYFNVSPHEMGVKSNFMSMVNQMRMGGPSQGNPWAEPEQELNVASIRRNRKVYSALSSIDALHRLILTVAYEPHVYPDAVLERFGDRRTGIVAHLPLTEKLAAQAGLGTTDYLATEDEVGILAILRNAAEELLYNAHLAFQKAFV